MRKLSALILTAMFAILVLTSAFTAYSAEEAGEELIEAQDVTVKYIKVGLRHGDSAMTKCVLKSASGFVLGRIDGDGNFSESLPLPAYSEIVATVEGGRVAIKDSNGVVLSQDIGIDGCLMPYQSNSQHIILEGRGYRGGILFKHLGGNKITVINILPLEEYLYGVVHREMGMTNPPEALKAQGITARTYAVLNLNRHKASGFDICAGTHCQVYGGVNDEYESTVSAVDETRGVLIYVDGKPVDTYYYKNSGGHTQNSEDVWTSSLAHLRGKPDPHCPDYPWYATMSFDVLRQKLKQGGMDPGNIREVKITGRNSAQAVSSMVVTGDLGSVVLNKTRVRDLLGSSLIRSTHFTIGEEYKRPGGTPGKSSFGLVANGGRLTVESDKEVYVIGADSIVTEGKLKNLWIHNGNKSSAMAEFIKEAEPGQFQDKPVTGGNSITFYGLGYGHGVGMAQDGAIEMAKKGMSYLDILTFYYTGIEVY